MILSLLFLAVVPVCGYLYAKKKYPERKAFITGMTMGSIISPFSMGLYATFFIPIIGLVPGIIGLISAMFHGTPGFTMATWLGIREGRTVVNFTEGISIEIINGIFWGVIYGIVGFGVDLLRSKFHSKNSVS